MAQTIILAPGTNAATSSDIVLGAGEEKTIGMYVPSGTIPGAIFMTVMLDTPGADTPVGYLTASRPAMAVSGRGTFRVVRGAFTTAAGVFTEG